MEIVVRQNRPKAANDNLNEIERLREHRVEVMARKLAHTIDRQRFMSAWVKIGQTQSI